jgi:hypothetical protein
MKTDKEIMAIRMAVAKRYEIEKPKDSVRFFINAYAEAPNRLTAQEQSRMLELVNSERLLRTTEKAKEEAPKKVKATSKVSEKKATRVFRRTKRGK